MLVSLQGFSAMVLLDSSRVNFCAELSPLERSTLQKHGIKRKFRLYHVSRKSGVLTAVMINVDEHNAHIKQNSELVCS
jgi:hypothetical protein